MLDSDLAVWDRSDDATAGFAGQPNGGPHFTLLGPLEVRKDGEDHAPTAPKVLQVLAMLLMRPGKVVQGDLIIKELWAGDPPRSGRNTMQTHVWHLRRYIEANGFASDGDQIIVTRAPGYLLRVDPGQVDVAVFQRLAREGRALFDRQHYAEAATVLRKALDLWGGPPLASVTCGPVLSVYATDLEEQRRNTQRLRIHAEIEAGMYHDLIGELRSLIAASPLDEGLNRQLMRVLNLSGRRIEALELYRQFRARLSGELGLEPCNELQELHHVLLSDQSHR